MEFAAKNRETDDEEGEDTPALIEFAAKKREADEEEEDTPALLEFAAKKRDTIG